MRPSHVERPLREQLADLARLARIGVRLAWRASPRSIAAVVALLLLQAILAPAELFLARLVLDRAALDLGLAPTNDQLVAAMPLAFWIGLAAGLLVLRQLLQPLAAALQSLAGDRVAGYVGEQLLLAANRWPGLARFEDPSFADDLDRVRRRATRSGLELVLFGTRFALAIATSLALMVALAGLHPLVPLLLLAATAPLMQRHHAYRQRTGSILYMQTPEARRLDYYKDAVLTVEPAKDVRLYGLGPFFRGRYDDVLGRTLDELDRVRRPMAVGVTLASALAGAAAGATYLYLAWRVAGGANSVGDFVLYGGAAAMLQSSLVGVAFDVGFLPWVFQLLPSLERVLAAPPDLPVPAVPRPLPSPIRQGILFDRVSFAYAGQAVPVLRELSFELRAGESVALVGQNGAGKTTLVKLLLRLYDPTAGRVLIDGVDLREMDPEALRRALGVVFQDFVKYELTARENVGLGQVDALDDAARIASAVERAGAEDLVATLSDGLDTRLGRQFGGRDLSGGEWQKLALARAFVRDCQVLVLDEPTAALDVQTEHAVYTRFHELTRGRTTLLISHRFSTVRMADRILFLADGRIAEEGTHDELLARGGEYARLYRLQAAQYVEEGAA